MRLRRFRINNFRSVRDSGWIEADKVTALIGVNESGKTNLLLPLWKLNPAREGEIQPTADYPKKMFGEIRANPDEYQFIEAEFDTEEYTASIARVAGITTDEAGVMSVRRFYSGRYEVFFPKHGRPSEAEPGAIKEALHAARSDVEALTPLRLEETLKTRLVKGLEEISTSTRLESPLTPDGLDEVIASLEALLPETPAKTSALVPRIQQTIETLTDVRAQLTAPGPGEDGTVRESLLKFLPPFVYYSNYGNLDSEIYLPHVVQNLRREDLGAREAAKARTLRVLFRFVRLEPPEILELGRDFADPDGRGREPTAVEITEIAEKKRERSILLQSAGADLTAKFKEWWRQGDYRFRFEADGNHFRIWVSDDRRPEEVELESRSTGLQWFLSFYLVFLVESEGEHRRAVLLLDEPGLSLHPLAQRALSKFFDNLSATNQLLYTTHSPFLVDADSLDRARKVFVADDGTTQATADLRYATGQERSEGAAYAVYSALNMSVAESLLLGCEPVLVEGPSDQHYLTAIKSLLIGANKISPKRELVFPPAGGTKTARVVASMLSGRDEKLPRVVLDGDEPGRRMTSELKSSLYVTEPGKILSTDTYAGFESSEIEDLFPATFLAQVVDRWERRPEVEFSSIVKSGQPIIPQIERWAQEHGIRLELGWKVYLAIRAKDIALTEGLAAFDDETVKTWVSLFTAFTEE